MIPKIIHQTWRDHNLPVPKAWPESWQRHNPDWEYRLWTDDDLLAFVRQCYPELEALYLSYPKPVQRADMARYLILHHHGGVYADIDTECMAPLDIIAGEERIIFSAEPLEQAFHAHRLGMDLVLSNAVMASPKGHPFWPYLCKAMIRCQHGKAHILETTGPLLLTGAYETYRDKDTISVSSCHLFNPLNMALTASPSPRFGDYAHHTVAHHYWGSTWFSRTRNTRRMRLELKLRRAIHRLTRGPVLTRTEMAKQIDTAVLHRPINAQELNISILIPVRDAAPFLERCFELLTQLTYPKDRLKIVFCEGDSRDDTKERLAELVSTHKNMFRAIEVTTLEVNSTLDRAKRWLPALQRERRSNLAKVRNHLIDHGITENDDWALWIDVDVCDYAPDIIERLLSEHEKVVTPDCVLDWDGPSYDRNAFNDAGERKNLTYYRWVRNGIYMPPAHHRARRHLHVLRSLERVPLASVGGTMLLVHAAVHKAGLRFPELPYDDLLETEGFGRMCCDFGVLPIGLPNVQIRHVRN
ncbi:glycosyltransferase [Yoonia sp. R78084]|uniref:glycosyltransferase n=1 Tax=Yoonia sp. R78084 TaxID=3093869 RepID=UPI0037DCA8FA